MSEWDSRVAQHEIHAVLAQLSDALGGVDEPEEVVAQEAIERAKRVVAAIQGFLNDVDPELVTPPMLAGVVSPSRAAAAAAQQYAATADGGQLRQLNQQLDVLLDAFSGWTVPRISATGEQLREAATSYRRSVAQLLKSIEGEGKDVQTEFAGLRGEFEQFRASQVALDAERKAQVEQLQASLDAQLADLKNTINSQKARLDTAIAEFQKQFSENEAQRLKAATDTINQARDSLTQTANSTIEQLRSEADSFIADLGQKKEAAEKLLDAVGAAALGGGYSKYARAQGWMAWGWAAFAILTLVAVTVAGIWILQTIGDHAFTLQDFWIRLVIVVPLLAISGYAITQSGKHRDNERRAKKAALELAALGPYIALVSPTEQEKIRVAMVEKFFGQPDAVGNQGEAVGAGQLWDEIRKMIGALLPGGK